MFLSTAPAILYDGPRGTGKTLATTHKAWYCAIKYPAARILLCREVRAAMTDSVLVTLEESTLGLDHYTVKYGPSRQQRSHYKFNNGSIITIASLEHVDRLRSAEYDLIIVYEAATGVSKEDYDTLLGCLDRRRRMPFNQIILECNPSYPTHWIMKAALKGDITRIISKHSDNPNISPKLLARLDTYTGVKRQRDLLGIWAAAEGQVYPDFANCIHDFDPTHLKGDRIGGLDWGYTDPFAALVGTRVIDETGDNIYIWYERYKSNTILRDHVAALPDALYYSDPSRPDLIADMRASGKRVHPAYTNDIAIGIQAVQRRIYDKTLHIHPSCKAVIAESTMYVWDEKRPDKPIDKYNHALDSLRYLLVSVDRRKIGHV